MNDHELIVMVRAMWYSVIVVVFNQTRHVGAMSKKQEKKKTPLEHWSPVSLIGIGVRHVLDIGTLPKMACRCNLK